MFLILFYILCIRGSITDRLEPVRGLHGIPRFYIPAGMKPLFLGVVYLQAHAEMTGNSVGQR